MVDSTSDSTPVAKSWDTYWHGTGEAGAFTSGGVNHPVIQAFWEDYFKTASQDYKSPQILDLASGNGAVVEQALSAFTPEKVEITCLDVSQAAITNIQNRLPGIRGMVADAGSIPLDSHSFNIVTSQFGIEYAGLTAVAEATRLVAAGGQLVLMMHNKDSSIHKECSANLDAVAQLQDSEFIPLAIQMLDAGFKACRGADRTPYENAATRLAPAVEALESIMLQHGEHIAGDTLQRLYLDVDRIHRDIQRYDPAEVLSWLGTMEAELDAFTGRMSSMCEAAIDSNNFETICSDLRDQGYTTIRAESLRAPDEDDALAWILIAANSSSLGNTNSLQTESGNAEPQAYLNRAQETLLADVDVTNNTEREKLQVWIQRQIDAALKELMANGVVKTQFVEAKPAWVLPYQILIGKIRRPNDPSATNWFICGEVPIDHLGAEAASNPRDAARHFAMKWQLDAARQEGESKQSSPDTATESQAQGSMLVEQAEALYALTESADLWS